MTDYNIVSGDDSIAYIVYCNDKLGDFCFGYFGDKQSASNYMRDNYPSMEYRIVGVTKA